MYDAQVTDLETFAPKFLLIFTTIMKNGIKR